MNGSSSHARQFRAMLAAPIVTILLLAGIVAEARTRVQATTAVPFHLRAKAVIQEAADKTVFVYIEGRGAWHSQDNAEDTSATTLLHPNILISRKYGLDGSATRRPEEADLLIVQCADARDLEGHYPPVCYPAHGDRPVGKPEARTWQVGSLTIHGMEYRFDHGINPLQSTVLTIYNFFVIPTDVSKDPNAGLYPDITAVYHVGEDYQRRYFGAAEFQVLTYSTTVDTPEERDQVFQDLVTPYINVIKTLQNEKSN